MHWRLQPFVFAGLLLLSLSHCGDDDDDSPSYQDALNAVRSFQGELKDIAGPSMVPVPPAQSLQLGSVMALASCDDNLFIGPPYENALDRFPDIPLRETALNSRFETRFVWKRDFSHNVDLGVKLLDRAIEAAFSVAQVDSLEVTLSLSGLRSIQVAQPVDLLRAYRTLLEDTGELAPGHGVITTMLLATMKLEYAAHNDRGQKIELKLPELVNQLDKVNGSYTYGTSESTDISGIQESEDGPTIIAIAYHDMPRELQDQASVNDQRAKLCGSADGRSQQVTLWGRSPVTDRPWVQFTLEDSTATAWGPRQYFVRVKNISGLNFDVLDYTLRFRNVYGQIIGEMSRSVIMFGADESRSHGMVPLAGELPALGDLTIEVSLRGMGRCMEDCSTFDCRSACGSQWLECNMGCDGADCRETCGEEQVLCKDQCDAEGLQCEDRCAAQFQ